jgi:hypothetical protein
MSETRKLAAILVTSSATPGLLARTKIASSHGFGPFGAI